MVYTTICHVYPLAASADYDQATLPGTMRQSSDATTYDHGTNGSAYEGADGLVRHEGMPRNPFFLQSCVFPVELGMAIKGIHPTPYQEENMDTC